MNEINTASTTPAPAADRPTALAEVESAQAPVALADLAERANAEHRLCVAAVNQGLDHAVRAGQLLLEAKAHGQGELFPAGKTAAASAEWKRWNRKSQQMDRTRWQRQCLRGRPVKGELTFHPIASIFPMMSDAEIASLAEDIRLHGLHDPVTTFEGQILDGRNRAKACKLAGVKLRAEPLQGTSYSHRNPVHQEAVAFVWSQNRERRHLTSGQVAAAEIKRAAMEAEYRAEIERMEAEARERQKANLKRGEETPVPVVQIVGQRDEGEHSRKTITKRAKAAGTNPEYLRQADKLQAEAPELAEKVLAGEVSLPAAVKALDAAVVARPPKQPRPAPGTPAAPEEELPPSVPRGVGVRYGKEAVDRLKLIPKNDRLRKRGFQIVTDWIKHNQ